ncbi:hypothetical protein FRC17_004716, partial [Serendipita sp. 399]
ALISRVYALWNRSRLFLILISTFFLVHIVVYVVLVFISYARGFTWPNLPPFTGCMYMTTFRHGWISLVLAVVFETVIVVLTVIRTYPLARQANIRTPLFTLLLRDGLFFYILIIISQVITLVAFLVPSQFTGPILESSPAIAVLSIACNRMLVRLQRTLIIATQDPYSGGSQTESVSARWTVGGSPKGSQGRGGGGGGGRPETRDGHQDGATLQNGGGEEITVPRLRKSSHGFGPAQQDQGGPPMSKPKSKSSLRILDMARPASATAPPSLKRQRSSMINVGMETPAASAERVAGLVLDFDSSDEEKEGGKGNTEESGTSNPEEVGVGTPSRPRRLSKTPPSSTKRRSSSATMLTGTTHGKSPGQQQQPLPARSRSGTASTLGLGLGAVISDLTSKRRKSSSAANLRGDLPSGQTKAAKASDPLVDVDLNGFESYSWISGMLDREIDLGGHYRSFSGLGSVVGGPRSPVSPVSPGFRSDREEQIEDTRALEDLEVKEKKRQEGGDMQRMGDDDVEKGLGTRADAAPILAHIEQHQRTYYSRPYSYFSTEGDLDVEEIPLQETGTSRASTSAHTPFSFSYESGKSVLDPRSTEGEPPKQSMSSSGHGSTKTRGSGGIRKFHEGLKSWSCCDDIHRPVLDFESFMKIPGCTPSVHTSATNLPVPKPVQTSGGPGSNLSTVRTDSSGKEVYSSLSSSTATQQPTTTIITQASLNASQTPLPPPPVIEEEDDLEVKVEPGTKCLRNGCKHLFVSDEESRGDGAQSTCIYHPKP